MAIWYSYFTMIVTVVLTFRGYVNNKKERMFYWFLYRMVFVTMDIVSIAIIDKFAIEEDSVNYWGLIVFSRVLMLAVVSFLKSKRPRQPDLKRDDLMVLVVIYGFCSLIMELIHFSLMTHLNNLNLVIEQYVFLGLVYVFVFGIGSGSAGYSMGSSVSSGTEGTSMTSSGRWGTCASSGSGTMGSS